MKKRNMRSTLKMPKLGDSANEVVIVELLVAVGDTVTEGQNLFVAETDKSQMEVPAPFGGTVKEIMIKVGDEVSNGDPFIVL
jgi:pyruvate/2-oxoglutarate dehydrogenase complex dihydrolipoamide acyltransferase (E2) component